MTFVMVPKEDSYTFYKTPEHDMRWNGLVLLFRDGRWAPWRRLAPRGDGCSHWAESSRAWRALLGGEEHEFSLS